MHHLPAAYRLLALGAGARDIERIHVNITVVNDFERLLVTWSGSLCIAKWFGRERYRPLVNIGIVANPEKCNAELNGGRGVGLYVTRQFSQRGGLTLNGTGAKLLIIRLLHN